jgi:hypothetical protein
VRGLALAAVALSVLAAPRAARAQTPLDDLPPVLLEDAGGGTRRAAVVGLSAIFAAVGLATAVGVGVEAAGPERPSWAWLGAAYGPGAATNLGLGIAWLVRERSGLATTLGVTHLAIGAANLGLGLWGAARPGRPPPKVAVVLTGSGAALRVVGF